MKEKLIYIVSFALAFAFVSGMLVYLNSSYNNIFKFDFSPVQYPKPVVADSLNSAQQAAPADSVKSDSTATAMDSLKVLADSVALANAAPQQKDGQINENDKSKKVDGKVAASANEKNQTAQPVEANITQAGQSQNQISIDDKKSKAKRDSVYNGWIKQTVKLYEAMDSRKAAKVIQGYSDNTARDILLKMKKKKAAEILAELKPEVVTRIISVN